MSTYNEIDAHDLSVMLTTQSLLLVDVRNDDEVARGVIQNAVHIPLAMLPVQYESLAKADNIVFYCHSGVRSAHAAAFAASKGCKHVYNLAGGVLAWARAGHPFVQINTPSR
ncbi:rhodanese-like domain-containing protein [Methylotenera mobilis]|jgi:rhodanese-related sulfurtransferase|uniref:Rhodanese-like domain-containing protein n=1 Tax=Methylotenera mobilis TaxID=359408 RepID=A0A351RCW9_9PROT|nr:rhodanese-like domain-containing protein [Methylotenera mobilis]PPC96063.1 MAG: rhodanese-like domain-containing protein [Methylotenera sp.]PPD45970.1 MAG: rhodanese-like domain-containing protein [Methylotenera sp.]HBA09890.1 rhodanese-like domain-containing protein [Methylotenera mobilis]